jgi:hypothetical protein
MVVAVDFDEKKTYDNLFYIYNKLSLWKTRLEFTVLKIK